MTQQLGQLSLLVRDYDEAINYYTETLGFELLEDTQLSETKRWVRVSPPSSSCHLLLAKASMRPKSLRLEIRQGVGFSCFYTQMTFTEILKTTDPKELNLSGNLQKKTMESFLFLKICMGICGI